MSDKIRLIVSPVDVNRWEEQERLMVPNSVIDTCQVCEESVWLSPEGHAMAYAPGNDVEIICTDCHIRLEIERKRRHDEEEDPVVSGVPGVEKYGITKRDVAGLRRLFQAAIEEGAKEGE